MAKPAAAARPRRKERKNITSGVAHVAATFNNTVITITDAQGNAIAWSSSGSRIQGQPQVHAIRRPGCRGGRRQEGARTRHGDAGDRGQRAWLRPGECAAGVAGGRLLDHRDPRHDADPAQRLPPAQAPARLTPLRSARPRSAGTLQAGAGGFAHFGGRAARRWASVPAQEDLGT